MVWGAPETSPMKVPKMQGYATALRQKLTRSFEMKTKDETAETGDRRPVRASGQGKRAPGFGWLLGVVGSVLAGGLAGAQTVPNAVVSTTQLLANVNGNSGHIAVNAFGTVFYVSSTDMTVYMLPLGATTPVALVTGVQYNTNVYVDAKNNLYVPGLYSGSNSILLEIPYVSGAYASLADTNVAACTSGTTVPCTAVTSGAGTTGYYVQVGDVGVDAAGDIFVMDARDNVSGTSYNRILKYASPAFSSLPTVVADNLTPQDNSAQIAVDALGDVYYADGVHCYSIPAGTSKPISIGTGLLAPNGVSVDLFGDLFITDSGVSGGQRILEMPAVKGVAQTGTQFTLSFNYSGNGVAVDPQGRIFFTGYANSSTNISLLTQFGNFGTLAQKTPSTTNTFTAVFNSPQTLTSLGLSGASNGAFAYTPGTCATGTAYASGGNCTFNVTYTPSAVGPQQGAVVLAGANGSIATTYLSGTGLGAAQTADPGTATAIGSGFMTPAGIAVDPANNVYVADTGANTVYRFAPGATVSTTVGTGLSAPTSVATDGAGNVFIADSGNGRVLEVPLVAGLPVNASQSVVLGGTAGTKGAVGIAVDLNGNLYVADSGNARVIKLATLSGTPSSNLLTTIGTGFVGPVAVTTDPAGDVFVADKMAGKVTEITPAGTTQTLGTSFVAPSGLALDAAGSVFVADAGTLSLVKIPLESGQYNANDSFTVGASVQKPYAVAIDTSSNLYVTDNANATATQLVRTQATLAFGLVNLGSSSSQLTGQISNSGNQTLVFNMPLYTASGATTQFVVSSPATNGCAAGGKLLTGFGCTLAAVFSPTIKQMSSDALTFSSNAANTPNPQLNLTGTGTFLAADTLVLAIASPTGAIALGTPVTITATVATSGSGTPSGMVTFFRNGNTQGTFPVVNGKATIVLTGLTGGSSMVGASYSGDTNFASASATPLSFSVQQSTTYTQFVIASPYNSPQSAAPGSSVGLNANIYQNGLFPPTGTVSFFNGKMLLGMVSVPTTGVADLATTLLPTGTLTVTAVYSGDTNYTGSTSLPQTLIISAPLFLITPASPKMTVTAGINSNVTLLATQIAGYSGTIGLSVCGSNPSAATCSTGLPADTVFSFNPNAFPLPSSQVSSASAPNPQPSSQQAVTLTVMTDQVPAIAPPTISTLRIPGTGTRVPVAFAFLLLAPLGLAGRRHLRRTGRMPMSRALLVLLILLGGAGAATLSGCSNSFLGTTAPGTYNLTIVVQGSTGTATTTPVVVNIPFTLTVQ